MIGREDGHNLVKKIILVMLLISLTVLSPATANVLYSSNDQLLFQEDAKAFPTAYGFGAETVGGRGGKVIQVTNLEDSGKGSLRSALEQEGPRIVVFRVGGTIKLQSDLKIKNPFITIAGQTAPYGGICIKNGTLKVATHDVVIRWIKVRPGAGIDSADAIELVNANKVVIDHVSASWSSDEGISAKNSQNVTIQWSIISEGILDHSYGSLIRGSSNFSIHHNLYALNRGRSPQISALGENQVKVHVANNIFYGYGQDATEIDGGDELINEDKMLINLVKNYYANSNDYPEKEINSEITISNDIKNELDLYLENNIGPHNTNNIVDQWALVKNKSKYSKDEILTYFPFPYPVIPTESAQEAYNLVLANVGATFPLRDAVDLRIINMVITRTGKLIKSHKDVGGYPDLGDVGSKPVDDSDGDGMPNAWEEIHGFNKSNDKDGAEDADGDGYTNVEEYLNFTHPRLKD